MIDSDNCREFDDGEVNLELKRRLFRIKKQIASGGSKRANRDMKLPARFFAKSLENFEGHEAEVRRAMSAVNAGKGVFLTGDCGTGKTHLAVALMNWWYADRAEYQEGKITNRD